MRRPAPRRPSRRPDRRGGALLLVLFVTVALGAVAASAVALTRTTSLVGAYYERERDFRYAAEAGLAVGRSRVQRDTTLALPDSGFVTVARAPVLDANGVALPRAGVTLYIGKSGITTGQYGQFVTVVARADDGRNTRYVRRLELAAENFARFAMFTNTWANGLAYGTGEFIRGLAWSNQTWASNGAPTYYDTVGAVGAITATGGPPTYVKGPGAVKPNQPAIPMPTVARLAFMPAYAAGANLSFTPAANAAMRLEFVAADLDGNGDSTGVADGFLRVFQSSAGTSNGVKFSDRVTLPDWNYASANNIPAWSDSLCGDFHGGKFYPAVVHKQSWFKADLTNRGIASTFETGIVTDDSKAYAPLPASEHDLVMRNPTARCYPAGAPQLVAVDRVPGADNGSGGKWAAGSQQVGGDETTFTPNGRWGSWKAWPATVDTSVSNGKRAAQAKWLFPLSKQLNSGWRGIIYVGGDAYVSGLVRSRVTLYGAGALTFLDDLTYVVPPNAPGADCNADNANMLGVIAVNNIMIDDNALQRPVRILNSSPPAAYDTNQVRFMSGTGPNFRLNGVLMSLTGTVGVTNPLTGPSVTAGNCAGQATSGGCIAQVGGVIEQSISATWTGKATGFAENREVDRCMLVTSPPYFPTTGRYLMNRYYESDPSRFDPVALFRSLQAG
ncbi:hypothetical protein tb265_17320 [Gemmatimonadetes bacterium T265]|nr:hypothetical protein tb265_17320 [Gemmatimonadetes bacterium T265]